MRISCFLVKTIYCQVVIRPFILSRSVPSCQQILPSITAVACCHRKVPVCFLVVVVEMTLAIGCRRGCLLLLLLLSGVVYCKCSSWHCCLPDFHVVDALSGRRLATRTEKPVHSLATLIRSLIKTSPSIVCPSCYLTNCVTLTCSNKLDSVACKHAADRHTFLLSRFAMRLWRRVWNTNIMFELIGDWTRQHTTGQDK